jgi:hypothetical protein
LEIRYFDPFRRVTVCFNLRRRELVLGFVVLVAVVVSLLGQGAKNLNTAGLFCLLQKIVKGA